MKALPQGWRIEENWYWTGMEADVEYVAMVWTTRAVKKHWWSKAQQRTGWFSAGYRHRHKDYVAEWIWDTATAAASSK